MEHEPSQTIDALLPAEAVERFRAVLGGSRVCVTGGAGFIGSHLVAALVALGVTVTVIDDLSNATAEHIAELIERNPERVRFIRGSILDPMALATATEGARSVFHLAALGSVPKSVDDPARAWVVNATGTMRVLQAAHSAGARRVIFSASSSAYGNNPELPKRESMAPEPESPYAAAKLGGEALCRAWAKCYGIDAVSLRYFNIFGPHQAADSAYAAVIPAFVDAYLRGEKPVIFGDGEQTRDFTHVSNAVYANLLAAVKSDDLGGAVLNIGAGVRTTVNQLASMIASELGTADITAEHRPERVGEVRDSYSSVDLAGSVIGYEPVTALDQGLADTLRWYTQRHAQTGTRGGT